MESCLVAPRFHSWFGRMIVLCRLWIRLDCWLGLHCGKQLKEALNRSFPATPPALIVIPFPDLQWAPKENLNLTMKDELSVREMRLDEALFVIRYFLNADHQFLRGMGVEPSKLPSESEWKERLETDLRRPLAERESFYLLWLSGDRPFGHSKINKIKCRSHAFMHLHIWAAEERRSGAADLLVRKSARLFFELFGLRRLFCEPCASNPAPNKTLPKAGFRLVRTYETVPGWINYQQTVNRWVLDRAAALTPDNGISSAPKRNKNLGETVPKRR